jgi:hypothetical protein
MASMRAGGKRIIKVRTTGAETVTQALLQLSRYVAWLCAQVPPELGFGDAGAVLRGTLHAGDKNGQVPPNAQLEYEVEILRISIPPS